MLNTLYVRSGGRVVSKDGLELVVQTNYLGHFLLTNLLKATRNYIMFLIIPAFLKDRPAKIDRP
jgi:hypothetical protein